MTRREAIALAIAGAASAQEIRYRNYSRILPDYLGELAREAYERRKAAILKLRTPDDIRARQAWARETFWKLIGGMPERTPLKTKTHGSFETAHYKVENLTYESQPGLIVTANLYIPKNQKPPFPGILFQAGHSPIGKAAEPYQKCCQTLARLGYLVLTLDPMGQGERTYYPKPNSTLTRLDSVDTEHTQPGKQMLLVGDTASRLQVWDAVRSLDVLASHPMVDPKRLASTGQSGGGTLTMMLAAVDDRLTAAAVSCGNTENFACADFNPPGSVDDAEQNFIGAGPLGFDRWDMLYPLAPKPLLVLASAHDSFGTYSPSYLTSGREEFAHLKRAYNTLGANNIEWFETPVAHGLQQELRTRIYNFFERHLRGSNEPVEEPELQAEPEKKLWCTPTGNVVRDLASKTPLILAREKRRSPTGDIRTLVQKKPISTATNSLGIIRAESGRIEAIEVESEPRVWLPGYLFIPKKDTATIHLALSPNGRHAHWREGDLYPNIASGGKLVAAFDIRGVGDLWPELGRGNSFYTTPHNTEDAYAWASLMLGSSLLQQRVADIIAIAQALKKRYPKHQIVLAADGHLGVPAIFAAALESSISSVHAPSALPSYASLLDAEDYTEPFANFIPGVLNVGDLPALRLRLAGHTEP